MDKHSAARTARNIVRLSQAGLDSRTLRINALRHLREVIPIDSFWFATADPATLLFTSSVVEDIPEHVTPALVANEFLQNDVNKFAQLARARSPVSGLYAATHGKPYSSLRYAEILAPLGFGDELRVALREGSSCWGFMCLHREQSSPGFTAEEAAYAGKIAKHLAMGLLVEELATMPNSDGPGLLVLAEDLSVAATTPAAERWLAEIADWPKRRELPQAIYGVAARLRALERDPLASTDLMPRARIRTPSGQWLVLHASRLSGPGTNGQTAVFLERASPPEVAPLILRAYDLTEREGAVARLVLQGLPTDQIMAELSISALTVQQHLKSVFDKTGVRSRRELVAEIFAHHYRPRLIVGARVGIDGWFA